jgi:apolipoprotein N-acyltransferase
MRALENGRWLLRATNNGITAIVDPQGVVLARLPRFEAGVLTGEYRVMRGQTPFNRLGPYPLYGLLLLLALVLAATGRRAHPAAGGKKPPE